MGLVGLVQYVQLPTAHLINRLKTHGRVQLPRPNIKILPE
jgi:hypothetical protein